MEKDSLSTTASSPTGDGLESTPNLRCVADWVAAMDPKPPSMERAEKCGAGFRTTMLQQLQPLPPAAPLYIPPPMPQPAVESDADEEEEAGKVETEGTNGVFEVPPDVIVHGYIEQRCSGLTSYFCTWRSQYMVLRSQVCEVFRCERDWQNGRQPTAKYDVARFLPNPDVVPERQRPGEELYMHSYFELRDTVTNEAFPMRCRGTTPDKEWDPVWCCAAKKVW
eukprot:CAMPEP_0178419476 /NCGR_PEP_ID=MMETSP0689_2-20121128/25630_1 /TAXON_ID=160604 /ORGANISM="Amphidinium massartii, Strain CS-259" /LENGTH=222 /DNA_ID=CAMNT_0020040915 /DNA_START=41 /DNA_END=706 /DNA_ORIENTATION=-